MPEGMTESLYEQDALAWAERQADLLARLAAGERLNEPVDWAHVIEEVRDVGLSELRSCESLLRQAMLHLLKLRVWPDSPSASHWRGEVVGFLADARSRFSPSMRQRIGLGELWGDAVRRLMLLGEGDDALDKARLPPECPFTLDDLLAKRPDVRELTRAVGGPSSGAGQPGRAIE